MRIMTFGGIEEGDDFSAAAPNADACWRLKLLKMGFKIDTEESHNGSLENCKIIGLGDYDAIRQIWVNHLKHYIMTRKLGKPEKTTSK